MIGSLVLSFLRGHGVGRTLREGGRQRGCDQGREGGNGHLEKRFCGQNPGKQRRIRSISASRFLENFEILIRDSRALLQQKPLSVMTSLLSVSDM